MQEASFSLLLKYKTHCLYLSAGGILITYHVKSEPKL